MIPLTRSQKEIIKEFYSIEPMRVIFNKEERNALWQRAKERGRFNYGKLKACPALIDQIKRSYKTRRNIQSAVFSECVYAQTLANLFNLTTFINCFENNSFIPDDVNERLNSYNLTARYAFSSTDKKRMLIEARGCGGVDSALITVFDLNIYTIEFKEREAKTSESVLYAINNNYKGKKFADVICTEDTEGRLVMIPSNQISLWADIEGEIRSAGRNHYKVWTPNKLKEYLIELGGKFNKDEVSISKDKLIERKQRGGGGRISGYKIRRS